MEKISSEILKTITDAATAHPVMATAAATGLLGGAMSMGTPQRQGETPGARRLRIIRNALLAAGQEAFKNVNTAVPVGDVDPVERKFTSPVGRGLMGAAGVAGFHGVPGMKENYGKYQKELGTAIGQPGLSLAAVNGPGGSAIESAIEKAVYAQKGSIPGGGKAEDLLKKLNLGAADRELYAAGLPKPSQLGEGGSLLERVARGVGRPAARGAYSLFGPAARLSGNARKLKAPMLRTGLGGALGLFLPEIVGGAAHLIKDYTTQPQ